MNELEKIDLIRERLKVSYGEANQALDEANGDVIKAIVKLETGQENEDKNENTQQKSYKDIINVKGQELVSRVKDLLKEGNVNNITVKNDEKTLLEIPVTAGVASMLIFPYITILAGFAALFKEYTLEIDKKAKE